MSTQRTGPRRGNDAANRQKVAKPTGDRLLATRVRVMVCRGEDVKACVDAASQWSAHGQEQWDYEEATA